MDLTRIGSCDEGKRRSEKLRLFISQQVQEVNSIVESFEKDFMVRGLDYDGRGRAQVSGYPCKETSKEMRRCKEDQFELTTERRAERGRCMGQNGRVEKSLEICVVATQCVL